MEGNAIPVEFAVKSHPKLTLAVISRHLAGFEAQASDFGLDARALADSSGNTESSDKTGQYGASISIQTLLSPQTQQTHPSLCREPPPPYKN